MRFDHNRPPGAHPLTGLLLCALVACGGGREAGKDDLPPPPPPPPSTELRAAAVEAAPRAVEAKSRVQLSRLQAEAVLKRAADLPALPVRTMGSPFVEGPSPPHRGVRTREALALPPAAEGVTPGASVAVVQVSPQGADQEARALFAALTGPAVDATEAGAAAHPPVTIEPAVQGVWRWVGSQTLVFAPTDGFPRATRFKVTMGTEPLASTGVHLGSPKIWTFSTPPPRLVESWPNEDQPAVTGTPILLRFDQDVNVGSVLRKLTLTAGGSRIHFSRVGRGTLGRFPEVLRRVAGHDPRRWVVVLPDKPLRAGVEVVIKLDRQLKSAEGPRETTVPQIARFKVRPRLEVASIGCFENQACRPLQAWTVQLTGPLDPASFDPAGVVVEPPVEKLTVELDPRHPDRLLLTGLMHGDRSYIVKLRAPLKDVHGQAANERAMGRVTVLAGAPGLRVGGEPLTVVSSGEAPTLPVFSVGHAGLRISLYRVSPNQWPLYLAARTAAGKRRRRSRLGKPTSSVVVEVQAVPGRVVETEVELGPALRGAHGHVVVEVVPLDETQSPAGPARRTWVQVTDLAPEVFGTPDGLLVWVTGRSSGEAIGGAAVALQYADRARTRSPIVRTTANGLAQISPVARLAETPSILLVGRAGDFAFVPDRLPQTPGARSVNTRGWSPPRSDRYRWSARTAEPRHRPGETVRVKGWLRRITAGPRGAVRLPAQVRTVGYRLLNPKSELLDRGTAEIASRTGSFDLAIELPKSLPPDRYRLALEVQGGVPIEGRQHRLEVVVAELPPPEYSVTIEGLAPSLQAGEEHTATLRAVGSDGLPLRNAAVRWRARRTPLLFSPPGFARFRFGSDPLPPETDAEWQILLEGRTSVDGEHTIRLELPDPQRDDPIRLELEATVLDADGIRWRALQTRQVHPAAAYVGLDAPTRIVGGEGDLAVEVVVLAPSGAPVKGQSVSVTAQQGQVTARCAITSSAQPARCQLRLDAAGPYRLRAELTGAAGRQGSTIDVWRLGTDYPQAAVLTVRPDRARYQPGQTARLLVHSPFFPAEGLLTLHREGLVKAVRFRVEGPTEVIEQKINEVHAPNVQVRVDLVGVGGEGVPPHRAHATAALIVTPPGHRLEVRIARPADRDPEPGAELPLVVEVRDAAGQPVSGAEVAVVVRAAPPNPPPPADPAAIFHALRSPGGRVLALRPVAETDEWLAIGREQEATDAAPPEGPLIPEEALRRNPRDWLARKPADAVVLWAPKLRTDGTGRATFDVTPPRVGTYRVEAIAATRTHGFGAGVTAFTARPAFELRASPPATVRLGDRFQLPIVVKNRQQSPLEVSVAARGGNAWLSGSAGETLLLPPLGEAIVRLPATPLHPGLAQFQVVGATKTTVRSLSINVRVLPPPGRVSGVVSGRLAGGAAVHSLPQPQGEVYWQAGGLQLTFASTGHPALGRTLARIVNEPGAGTVGRASRLLALASLLPVLDRLGLSERRRAALDALARRDVAWLAAQIGVDGQTPRWSAGEQIGDPFVSVFAAHALARARQAGLPVPLPPLRRLLLALRALDDHLGGLASDARWVVRAHALEVRRRLGDPDPGRASAWLKQTPPDRLPAEAVAWILPTLAQLDPQPADTKATVAAMVALLSERVSRVGHVDAKPVRAGTRVLLAPDALDAVVLAALVAASDDSAATGRLASGLLSRRREGRWGGMTDGLAVAALGDAFGAISPEGYDARVWLGKRYLGARRGQAGTTAQIRVPIGALAELEGIPLLTVRQEGAGVLYYLAEFDLAPIRSLAPEQTGFVVDRVLEGLDGPDDVRRLEDGSWWVRSGARVRVTLNVLTDADREAVEVRDRLSAGLVALGPATAPDRFVHQETSEHGVTLVADALPAGVYPLSYEARAVHVGRFTVGAGEVRAADNPALYGRSPAARLIVRSTPPSE